VAPHPLAKDAIHQGWLTFPALGRRAPRVRRFVFAFQEYQATGSEMHEMDTHNKGYLLKPGRVYAEIAFVRLLGRAGWNAVWIDNYKGKSWRDMPYRKRVAGLPDAEQTLYDEIEHASGRGGCWDIWAWRGNQHLFVEAKRIGRDKIRTNQLRWLEAATSVGLPQSLFCVAGWFLEGRD